MKTVAFILLVLLAIVQYGLWVSPNGVSDLVRLNQDMEGVRADVDELHGKNKFLAAEVLDLRTGTEALEERARSDLGMILSDETFFQVIEAPKKDYPVEPYSVPSEGKPAKISLPETRSSIDQNQNQNDKN